MAEETSSLSFHTNRYRHLPLLLGVWELRGPGVKGFRFYGVWFRV